MAGIAITRITIVAALTVLLVAAGSASATDRHVYEGGSIQTAVDAASQGDTIIVHDGTYTENVKVNKSRLTIRSENGPESTTVVANHSNKHVFKVTADYVNISGFNVTGAKRGPLRAGIRLKGVRQCNISNNVVTGNNVGISLLNSRNNVITKNVVTGNNIGIRLRNSDNNNITGNRVQNNILSGFVLTGSTGNNIGHNSITAEIVLTRTVSPSCWECPVGQCDITTNVANGNYVGIGLLNSDNNNITKNVITGNYVGIGLFNSDNNNITCNRVQNNTLSGFVLTRGSTGNTIERNNIIENGESKGGGIYHYQFRNLQCQCVDAKNNYWGTNDTSVIKNSIKLKRSCFPVYYDPIKTGACPCAPVPELPTIALLAVGLLALVGCSRTGRKE